MVIDCLNINMRIIQRFVKREIWRFLKLDRIREKEAPFRTKKDNTQRRIIYIMYNWLFQIRGYYDLQVFLF